MASQERQTARMAGPKPPYQAARTMATKKARKGKRSPSSGSRATRVAVARTTPATAMR